MGYKTQNLEDNALLSLMVKYITKRNDILSLNSQMFNQEIALSLEME